MIPEGMELSTLTPRGPLSVEEANLVEGALDDALVAMAYSDMPTQHIEVIALMRAAWLCEAYKAQRVAEGFER